MTEKDYEAYHFIVSYIKKNGYSPTIREIAKGIGIASTSAVSNRLLRLERAGRIKIKPYEPRAIKVVGYKFVKECKS